jgi:modulator of FtsH protease HflC
MKRSPLTIAIAAVLILIFGLMLFVFQVRKSEVAVITLFQKVVRVKGDHNDPGPGLRWPWPIETVYKLDWRIQNFEDGDKLDEVKLKDQNIVLLRTYVGWQITNAAEFFPKFRDGSIAEAEKTLVPLVRTVKAEVAGQHVFSDFVSADQGQMKFTQIEDEILKLVQNELRTNHYGLEVKFVQFQQIELAQTVTQNVLDRMQSEREKYISAIKADGEEQASIIRSAADRDAARYVTDADNKAKEIRGKGEAEMVESLRVLSQNPALATFIMELATLDDMFKQNTSWIVDQSQIPLDLLQARKPQKSQTTNTNADGIAQRAPASASQPAVNQ